MRPLAAVALLACAPACACPGLEIEGAWIREVPPGAMMTAAYGRLTNRGSQLLVVDGGFSKDFASAELHRTVIENGMFRMVADRLELAPGASAALEPGGLHLMLMRPARPLKAGDTLPLAFTCGRQAREFTFTVRAGE
jgi:hypothetical protein